MDFEIEIPELEGDAKAAVELRSGHIQIIASAGSGKTETISQRVAKLISEGVAPETIVAFTFTTRAAAELKQRIRDRVLKFAGQSKADLLGTMYVGTIHGYCLQMLQRNVSKYETYSVLDDKQQVAFLQRYERQLGLEQFRHTKLRFNGIERFRSNVEVLENELLDFGVMDPEFQEAAKTYRELLEEHKFLTYGLQISEAVRVLEDEKNRLAITDGIRHLIVDEYQDVNPAQERLISLLSSGTDVQLTVVGDDDQAIYQWRGSSVENIIKFADRYPQVTSFELLTNRRSRPEIVKIANGFAKSIPGRLDKEMRSSREPNGPAVSIAEFDTEYMEAADIAESIATLVERGYEYRQIAILVRGRAAYPAILRALKLHGIPVLPGDREGLFNKDDADFLGRCFVFFADEKWKKDLYSPELETVELEDLMGLAAALYALSPDELEKLRSYLLQVKESVGTDSRKINLVEVAYEISARIGVRAWNTQDASTSARLGTVSKVIKFVADYEAMAKSARVSSNDDGAQVGAPDRGVWYFRNLASLLTGYAIGEYRDFEGEVDESSNAVDLLTVHSAKGLEWPIVFMPSLTAKRFPSAKTGQKPSHGPWLVPTDLFDADRYQGTDDDERRLFYVALTRAREWVSLSRHSKIRVKSTKISPYLEAVKKEHLSTLDFPAEWSSDVEKENKELQITYSELADFLNCGFSFWLRNRLGFPPQIVSEIGYGRAVHHLMRTIAEATMDRGRSLDPGDIERILAKEFFLPFAGKALHERFRNSAKKLIDGYLANHSEELQKVWETERPFELALPGVVVSGRADVVLDRHNLTRDSLSIIDYKTRADATAESDQISFDLQLQIYSEAGIREGLDVKAAFVHGLDADTRIEVPIDKASRDAAVNKVMEAAEAIKARIFEASPAKHKCGICDVRAICRSAVDK